MYKTWSSVEEEEKGWSVPSTMNERFVKKTTTLKELKKTVRIVMSTWGDQSCVLLSCVSLSSCQAVGYGTTLNFTILEPCVCVCVCWGVVGGHEGVCQWNEVGVAYHTRALYAFLKLPAVAVAIAFAVEDTGIGLCVCEMMYLTALQTEQLSYYLLFQFS